MQTLQKVVERPSRLGLKNNSSECSFLPPCSLFPMILPSEDDERWTYGDARPIITLTDSKR